MAFVVSWRRQAACAGIGVQWGRMEFAAEVTLQSKDRMPRKKRIIAAQIQEALVICEDCPVRGLCREWAAQDNYSGIAGGEFWKSGKPMGIPNQK